MQHFLTPLLIAGFATSALSYDIAWMARPIEKHECIVALGAVVSDPESCRTWTRHETAEPFVDQDSSRIFIGGSDAFLHMLDAKKGKTLKRLKLEGSLMSSIASVEGDLIFGTDKGFAYRVKKDGLSILWKVKLNSGLLQAPYLVQDKVVFVTQLGTIFALKTQNGEVAWSRKRELPNRIFLGHLSTPVALTWPVKGNTREILAIGTPNGALEFLSTENGEPVVEERLLGSKDLFGDVATTPVFADNILYVASFNRGLVAIDGERGVRWEIKEKGITELAIGNDILVAAGAKFVMGINPKTGKVIWRDPYDRGAPTAIRIKGSEVILGSDLDRLYVLGLKGNFTQVLGSGLGFSGKVHDLEDGMLAMSSAGALFFFDRADRVVSGRKLALERYESGR